MKLSDNHGNELIFRTIRQRKNKKEILVAGQVLTANIDAYDGEPCKFIFIPFKWKKNRWVSSGICRHRFYGHPRMHLRPIWMSDMDFIWYWAELVPEDEAKRIETLADI